jgi:hypothetical protein
MSFGVGDREDRFALLHHRQFDVIIDNRRSLDNAAQPLRASVVKARVRGLHRTGAVSEDQGMDDWAYAHTEPSDTLARLHHFLLKKQQDGREIEFVITVREHAPDKDQSMRFLAQADKQTNQKTAPFTPTGWGSSLLDALSQCVKAIYRFPYEGE